MFLFFFFSSRRRHTRFKCDWSSDVCSSDLSVSRGDPRPLRHGSPGDGIHPHPGPVLPVRAHGAPECIPGATLHGCGTLSHIACGWISGAGADAFDRGPMAMRGVPRGGLWREWGGALLSRIPEVN